MLGQVVVSGALSLLRSGAGSSLLSSQLIWNVQGRANHWQSSLLGLRAALPMRAEPRKKKKVDQKRDIAIRDRLRKKIKKLQKAPQELIPIEDFITPFRFLDEKRVRDTPPLSPEESERRALLMKKWSFYKQKEHEAENSIIKSLVDAQEAALKELRLESEELYEAAIQRDDGLFPFERQELMHSPPLPKYEAPEGKCVDVTKVYTQ
ncbi:large ribosomal subunit protein mL40 [Podarcis muralis]|uniref:39S ribosomal protein L40, mitochondrial isoform X1 n=1 Tax=Podarcis muralis TaxID=64176 RepID=UPI0010A0BCA3|nr:39S ribosomal protein L40, mitochondrial isoform X1 [Podarcis muralis]